MKGSVFGTFGGLAEGALISWFRENVFITCRAGDGNDIALFTENGAPPAPVPLPTSLPLFLAALVSLWGLRGSHSASKE